VDAASFHGPVEILVASLFVALTTVLVYFVGRLFLSRSSSVVLAAVFAFCTPAWSTASRALWQHGPSMLMLTAALLIVLRAREKPFLVQYASVPLALSFIIRPTNALSIIALTLFVALRHRGYLARYLVWGLAVAIPFLAYNVSIYHAVVSPYYLPQRVGAGVHFLEALAGNLVSPSRGLFTFSPVLAFSICGMALGLRSQKDRLLDFSLFAVIILHWLAVSSYPHWYGGYSFGPRFSADMVPYLVYFLVPVLQRLSRMHGVGKATLSAALALSVAASFLIHLSGAVNRGTVLWNSTPVDVDEAPWRVWDWNDPQFLRGVLRK
jgi:hypothetical protein